MNASDDQGDDGTELAADLCGRLVQLVASLLLLVVLFAAAGCSHAPARKRAAVAAAVGFGVAWVATVGYIATRPGPPRR